ncbi:MAG: TetR/AcrR family transcriptional regulator [Chloroflexota bacterium]
MPYPSQVSRETIVTQAWQLIEAEGAENLSLGKLAEALGIKAPSLYRHVGSKAGLLQAVNLHTSQQLVAALNEAAARPTGTPKEQTAAILHAYRHFALAHPHTYVLAFTNTEEAQRPDEDVLEQLALPLQQVMSAVSGPEDSLAALRGAMALVHGFVMLELHGQLRRGGDLGADFETAVHAYLNGW